MLSQSASVIPEDLTAEDWRGLLATYPNTLLIGPADATARVLDALTPRLRQPIARCDAAGLSLPADPAGTLIINDVTTLSAADQERLLEWLVEPSRLTQVVATATGAVFPQVADGAFLDVLFYRLNVMSFTLGARRPA